MVPIKYLSKKREEIITYVMDVVIIAILIIVLSFLPFEAILSEYPYAPTFPWHPYWRMGLISFFIWFGSILALTAGYAHAKPFVYLSSVFLIALHYLTISVLPHTCSVSIWLLTYTGNCKGKNSPTCLDVAQIALLLTVLMIFLEKRRKDKGTI